MQAMCEGLGEKFVGTSNCLIAKNRDLEAIGTNAHELPMVYAALAPDDAALAQAPGRPAELRDTLNVPKAAAILQKDHYGWFERVERGVYRLRDGGHAALETYADVLAEMAQHAAEP